ncbi:WRKY domain-containing protein [Heracleum sosnowskyi]|uniref:WRKY domain-containing protein n=1 Tax=Heracleum sosnowskyi TaxID=360622 RepID=A0AAD8I218_9APIA|nr:WRKY domain-containing protein [Heracleum sosnowskyi]
MEKGLGIQQKILMNIELKQGQDLANQLKKQLYSPKRSVETCEFLVTRLLSSYEKALSILNKGGATTKAVVGCSLGSPGEKKILPPPLILKSGAFKLEDDPCTSPRSEKSDEPRKNVLKKRKTMTQWSEQVQVPLGTGVEGPLGDESSWRKYGQKNIFGATFPRAYYRCTYRNSQGCLATKQVQRSDESLSLILVNYKGRHACKKGSESSARSASCGNEEKRHKTQKQNGEKTNNFRMCHKTEELGKGTEVERSPSFTFPSTIVEFVYKENHFYSGDTRQNSFIDSRYLPSSINQETSECSYLSLSPYHNMNNFEFDQSLPSSESGLTEILSAPNSVTNSPIGDFNISLDPVDFNPNNFPLDILEFFS